MAWYQRYYTITNSREAWLRGDRFKFERVTGEPRYILDWMNREIAQRTRRDEVVWCCRPDDPADTVRALQGIIDAPIVPGKHMSSIRLKTAMVPWFDLLVSDEFVETQALMHDMYTGASNPYVKLVHKNTKHGYKVWAQTVTGRDLICTRTQTHTVFSARANQWYYADPQALANQLARQLNIPQHLI